MPFPALKEAARANSIPLEQLILQSSNQPKRRDSFTALVTLHERAVVHAMAALLEVVGPVQGTGRPAPRR